MSPQLVTLYICYIIMDMLYLLTGNDTNNTNNFVT